MIGIMKDSSTNELPNLLEKVRNYVDDPTKGLNEDLFLFVTETTPMVNVDLLIKDESGRILLSWRDDRFYGTGWHVPGGILRLKENFEDRIQKTARIEIGCESIMFDKQPLDIVPIICPEMKVRGHFITFVYSCSLPDGYSVKNGNKQEHDAGFLKWHKYFPMNMIGVHAFYKRYFLEK